MSIQNENLRDDLIASEGETEFDYSFKILDEDHIEVRVNDVVQSGGYTVDGVGESTGGTVTFSSGQTAGDLISLILSPPFTQLTSYLPNSKFPETTHERALDKLTQLCLTLRGQFNTFSDQIVQSAKGTTTVGADVSSVTITLNTSFSDSNYNISATPRWNSNGWWITNKTGEGFTLNFAVPPDSSSSVEWKADNLTFLSVTPGDLLVPTFLTGAVPFAIGTSNLSQTSQLLWDSVLNTFTAGIGKISSTNNISTIFSSPDNTANRAATYFAYSDAGDHENELHSVVSISGQPVGSGTNGPPSVDVGLTISNLKQDFSTPSTVGGEVSGAYIFVRNGTTGDTDGLLIDVAAYDNTGFTNIMEGINRHVDAGVVTVDIDVQLGVIRTGLTQVIGFAATPLTGQGTDVIYAGGTWSRGINFQDATIGTAVALGNTHAIGWKDTGGTLRNALTALSDNVIYLGWDATPTTNGHVVIRGGGTEWARFSPSVSLTSGQTVLSVKYHDGSVLTEDIVVVGANDSAGAGLRALAVPNA